MGNRSYIQIDSGSFPDPIILYGHWSGEDNLTAVRNVLARTDRVGDAPYLTAQIFYEFSVGLGGYDGTLGFGIWTGSLRPDRWKDSDLVVINADSGIYEYRGEVYSERVRLGVS
jgi:hypothetical protein